MNNYQNNILGFLSLLGLAGIAVILGILVPVEMFKAGQPLWAIVQFIVVYKYIAERVTYNDNDR